MTNIESAITASLPLVLYIIYLIAFTEKTLVEIFKSILALCLWACFMLTAISVICFVLKFILNLVF